MVIYHLQVNDFCKGTPVHHQLLKCCRSHATKMEWWQLIIQAIFFSEWYLLVDILVLYNWPIVTRKGNWPIQQVLYLPAFFLVPPLTILTMHCMPFPWFQWLLFACALVLPGRAANTHSMVHAEMCWGIARPKRNQLTESGYFWDGAISCHVVDH